MLPTVVLFSVLTAIAQSAPLPMPVTKVRTEQSIRLMGVLCSHRTCDRPLRNFLRGTTIILVSPLRSKAFRAGRAEGRASSKMLSANLSVTFLRLRQRTGSMKLMQDPGGCPSPQEVAWQELLPRPDTVLPRRPRGHHPRCNLRHRECTLFGITSQNAKLIVLGAKADLNIGLSKRLLPGGLFSGGGLLGGGNGLISSHHIPYKNGDECWTSGRRGIWNNTLCVLVRTLFQL